MRLRLYRCCLVDQHDGDVIPDWVAEAIRVANQRGLLLAVFELALAFRADQDGEELWRQCHGRKRNTLAADATRVQGGAGDGLLSRALSDGVPSAL
jgi:hypothetical protein